jgi:signal transduction histidine kinase
MSEPINILLVDDEQRNLDALEAILDEPSYRLLRADEADKALKLLLDNDVAAIVLDIKMPVVSGFELAKMIKGTKKFRQIPIVFLTAHLLDDQDVITGYGAGAVDYLTKPVNPDILRHKIAIFADLFRKTRALAELNENLEQRVRERTAELERSEEALREANKQKDQFLATLAHELRNPLAPLRTGLDILIQQPSHSEVALRTLAAMNRQLTHVVRLIDDLLDVSRIVAGKMQLEKRPVELRPVIEAAVDKLRPDAETNRVTIDIAAGPGAGVVLGDPVRLEQILINLVSNAIKFTPPGGRVSVSLVRADNEVKIVVRDTGEGIDAQVIPYVFDRFRQVDGTRTRRAGGLGLGLAIVRSLAQLHGGTVTAESAGRGSGATFTVALPVLAVRLAEPRRGPAGDPAPRRAGASLQRLEGLRVLVVDDHRDSREMIGTVLAEGGATVQLVGSADEALQRLQHWQTDVLISDLGMPGLDGFDLIRAVRAQEEAAAPSRHLVAMALSAYASDEDRARALAAGFQSYAPKPIDPADLVALVARTARGPAGERV